MTFMNDVSSFFSDAWHGLEDMTKTIYNDITGGAKAVYNTVDTAITNVSRAPSQIVAGATHVTDNIQNTVTGLGNNVQNTVTGGLESLSMPMIALGAVGLVLLLKK